MYLGGEKQKVGKYLLLMLLLQFKVMFFLCQKSSSPDFCSRLMRWRLSSERESAFLAFLCHVNVARLTFLFSWIQSLFKSRMKSSPVIMGDLSERREEDSTTGTCKWSFGSGEGSWQGRGSAIRERTGHLYNNPQMSDILLNACDENWWFGDTVRDFNAHQFLLATASPVLHKILYDWEESAKDEERLLVLDPDLEVSLRLVKCYDYHRLELEGVPPIAAEALLEYIYKD